MSGAGRRTRRHRWLFRCVLLHSLTSCVSGIAYAIGCGTATDGQRGGTVGVALSFSALFVARPVPAEVLEQEDMLNNEPSLLGQRLMLLRTALSAMLDSQRQETAYRAASSVVSTLIGGFGD